MQRVEAEIAVSVSEFKKDPGRVLDGVIGSPVAIIENDRVMASMVPASTYEAMIDALDDQALADIAKARAGEQGVPVELDEL
jgi:antitoxin StbD